MIAAESKKLLWDARTACERIVRFIGGRTFEDYVQDDMLRAAVERQFEIVGEALAALRRTDVATANSISSLARIVAFRNILIHGYATIDNQLVWGIIEASLPELQETLADLLDK